MSQGVSWLILVIAGLFETGWAIGLKYSHGFTKFWPSVWTALSMSLSVFLLSLALKKIPVGTGYAVWTGIGAVGVAILGMILFNESRDLARIICIFLIICGIVGLKIFS